MQKPKLRTLCIRHGQTDWNLEGRYCGHADVPLNASGLAAAKQLAKELAEVPLDAVYASDLKRALDTARLIAAPHNLTIKIDDRLRELDQGEWQGLLFSDIKERYAEIFASREADPLRFSPPGGETVEEVRTRAVNAVEEIRARHPEGGTIAIVSHGFTLALLRVHYSQIDITKVWDYIPPNTTVVELEL